MLPHSLIFWDDTFQGPEDRLGPVFTGCCGLKGKGQVQQWLSTARCWLCRGQKGPGAHHTCVLDKCAGISGMGREHAAPIIVAH